MMNQKVASKAAKTISGSQKLNLYKRKFYKCHLGNWLKTIQQQSRTAFFLLREVKQMRVDKFVLSYRCVNRKRKGYHVR